MSYRVPTSAEEYNRDNDQAARSALATQIEDVERVTKRIQTSDGTISLGDGTLTLANGANNNVAAGYDTYMQVSGPTAAFSITGIVPVRGAGNTAQRGAIGRWLVLRNPTAYTMTIAHQSGSSSAVNRIITSTAADVELAAGTTAMLIYNAAAARWHLVDMVALALTLSTLSVDTLTVTGTATLPNEGLHLLDTNASHDLIIKPGSDLTTDRTLTLTTGDDNRTLTLGADSSISGTAYVVGGTDVAIADGGTGASTASAAFSALKQDASENDTGVVELATTTEVITGTDTTRAVTAAGVGARLLAEDCSLIETLSTSSGSTATSSTLGEYRQLLIWVENVGFATQETLAIELSDDDGSSYSSKYQIAPAMTNSGHTTYAIVIIDGVGKSGGSKLISSNARTGADYLNYVSLESTETGKTNKVRFSALDGTGTFDGGDINIYGIK